MNNGREVGVFTSACWPAALLLPISDLLGYVGDALGHQWPLMLSGIVLVLAAGLLYGNRREIFQMEPPACACSAS